jgi:RNA polymerase sigma-54 factor
VQSQKISLQQTQQLKMSPQLLQSIKLMELPIIDLRERIEEEVERNPALEMLNDPSVISLDAGVKAQKEEDDYSDGASDPGFARHGSSEDSDEHHKMIEGVLSRSETLQEHLLWQLYLQPLDDESRQIGELLIQNLNDDGFHREPLNQLFADNDSQKTEHMLKVERMLNMIRSFDPVGTCTVDYKESLRVQSRLMQNPPLCIEEVLEYLEPLERGRFQEVAKKTGLKEPEIREIFERIKELSPFPGRQFSSGETRFVVPDVQVLKKEGNFVIKLNEEEIPVLGINPFFMQLSDEKGGEKAARDFVKENIKEARWFIQSINQRNHTLLKVTRAIVEFQRSFFVNGPKYIAPLTLKDIASEIGVHETTVSRTANGKYMQTEWGIFEIKHFFTNSISGAGSSGSRYSKEGVKEILRELILAADKKLSDQDIADQLAKRGIPLARRTVAKYRNELDLGSSYTR